MRVLLCLAAIAMLGSAAWAQGTAPAAPENPQTKVVCEKGDPPAGSHIAGTSVCHTAAEWEEIHRNSQDFLSRVQSGASQGIGH